MHDPVHVIDRIVMRGGVGGLETAPLIDRHVNQRRARLHIRKLRPADQFRRRRAGDQHRADHQDPPRSPASSVLPFDA